MNQQVSNRSVVAGPNPAKSWQKISIGVGLIAIILLVVGVFAAASFADTNNRTLQGGDALTVMCDGDELDIDRVSRSQMVVTCVVEGVPTVVPTTAPIGAPGGCDTSPSNVVQNYSFEGGNNGWSFHTDGKGSFNVKDGNSGYCDNAAQIRIDKAGGNVQLYQAGIALEPNTDYVLRFTAKSNSGNDVMVRLFKHQADYTNYGLRRYVADLSPEWQQYEVEFTTTGFSRPVNNGRLQFWLAPYDKAGDQYWIDQIELVKKSETAQLPPVAPNPINPVPTEEPAPIVEPVPNNGTYYVATNGKDSNAGTERAPFATIQHAVDLAQPGDTIYVRGGRYVQMVEFKKSGVAGKPITLAAYPGERPIIDGEYTLPPVPNQGWQTCNTTVSPPKCFHYIPLIEVAASHIVIDGFEVRHSLGRAVWVYNKHERVGHITIRNMDIHDNRNAGIKMLRADHVLFESNRVWHNSDYATHDRGAKVYNWTHAVNALESTHITYLNNEIFNNYGEGIGTGRGSSNVLVKNNEIYDNLALQVYIHRSTDSVVEGNHIYCTGDSNFFRGGDVPSGIVANNEYNFPHLSVVDNVTIKENIVVGCRHGFSVWAGGGDIKVGSKNITVENNVFVNMRSETGLKSYSPFLIGNADGKHRNIIIRDNYIYVSYEKAAYVTSDAVTFRSNHWLVQPNSIAQGRGDTYGQISLSNPDARLVPGRFDAGNYQLRN